MDMEAAGEESDDDSDDEDGNFFNELYSVEVEGERATWHLISLTGRRDPAEKKKRRKEKGEEEEVEEVDAMEDGDCDADIKDLAIDSEAAKTVTVQSGNFTVSSTVGAELETSGGASAAAVNKIKDCFVPCGRFNSG